MYLKSIEIHGFKSFANRVVFRFRHGITGIVGPNGSGKSNIGDAVRWVLGEQSAKQLRGSKMEDVIFSGTQIRKPMNSAYVAITLDNGDHSLPIEYEEVVVARRVYRSGESEYLLNGMACRRKDIVELFFDTGIGKEGYSIIGQGQVEKILNGKPEERRELFDEAAGIIKYKKNKATAEKSLEKERENLNRVNDILSELERQVGPLKNQSEKAKEYVTYREKLKDADLKVFLLEQEQLRKEQKEIEIRLTRSEETIAKQKEQYETRKTETEQLEEVLGSLRETIDEKNKKIQEQKVEREKLDGESNVLKEQIKTEQTKEEHYYADLSRVESELHGKRQELASVQQKKQQLLHRKDENGQKEKEIRWALDAVEQESLEKKKELEELLGHLQGSVQNKADIQSKMERFATVREQLDLRIADVEKRLASNRTEYEQALKRRDDYQEQIIEFQKQSEEAKKSIAQAMDVRKGYVLKGNELARKGEDKKQEFFRIQSKLEALRNMSERYDGYGVSIKKVMEQKSRQAGIIGVVADIIQVEKKYEIAVETALGGSIQNIVTDDEETAKKMIAFLKEHRFGRATFLPLTAVKNRNPFRKTEALREEGVIGLASELVETKQEFRDLINSLLGKTVIVDTIDHGIALARKYHYSMRIVTREGESLNAGGSMTGGAFRNSSNLLARKREMEDVKKQEEKKKQEYDALKAEYDEIQAQKEAIEEQIAKIEREEQARSLQLNTLVLNKQERENRCREMESIRDQWEEEKVAFETEKQEMAEHVKNLHKEREGLEEKNQSAQSRQKALEERIEALKKEEDRQVESLSEVQMQANSYEQQLKFSLENENRVLEEIGRLEYDLAEIKADAGEREDTVEQIRERIRSIGTRMDTLANEIMDGEVALKEAQQEENQKNQTYKHSLEERESIHEKIAQTEKECYRLETGKEKLEEQMQEQTVYMWETYEMTYRMAKEALGEEIIESIADLKKEGSKWRKKIKALGSVNMEAVEEYEQVSERYEFLLRQQEDIVKAEEQLTQLIGSLEKEMRALFKEKFEEIQAMFQKVFLEMFGGGQARLELMEEQDILEAGIRIIAQPPGKKLQNMMQLSGGEKALTAISLLFAIQSLKPSPFCLLDEIEAALDDSNVVRFSQYLHKLTKDTQFIVITHRKGTMTAADMLYGITMQEKGVSTLVSVSLIEKDLDN